MQRSYGAALASPSRASASATSARATALNSASWIATPIVLKSWPDRPAKRTQRLAYRRASPPFGPAPSYSRPTTHSRDAPRPLRSNDASRPPGFAVLAIGWGTVQTTGGSVAISQAGFKLAIVAISRARSSWRASRTRCASTISDADRWAVFAPIPGPREGGAILRALPRGGGAVIARSGRGRLPSHQARGRGMSGQSPRARASRQPHGQRVQTALPRALAATEATAQPSVRLFSLHSCAVPLDGPNP